MRIKRWQDDIGVCSTDTGYSMGPVVLVDAEEVHRHRNLIEVAIRHHAVEIGGIPLDHVRGIASRQRIEEPPVGVAVRALKVSQIDGDRPSFETAPSIWYDAVAFPTESRRTSRS